MNNSKPFLPDDVVRCSGKVLSGMGYATPLCVSCARRMAPINGEMCSMMGPNETKDNCEHYINEHSILRRV
jgi:hypothetical protein